MVGAVIGLPATGVVEGVGALCDEELAGAGGGRLASVGAATIGGVGSVDCARLLPRRE
jgi:hypothetical protein